MSQFQQACIFCGGKGVTKEHLLGKWTRKTDQAALAFRMAQTAPFCTHQLIKPPQEQTDAPWTIDKGRGERQGTRRSTTLKIVCKKCNNEWMSEVVNSARLFIQEIENGEWPNFNQDSVEKIARWISLITATHEFLDPDTVSLSSRCRDDIRVNTKISHYWRIAIGMAPPDFYSDLYLHRALRWIGVACHDRAQISGFFLGRAFLISIWSECAFEFDFEKFADEGHLLSIWPYFTPCKAPPSGWVREDAVDHLVNRATQLLL